MKNAISPLQAALMSACLLTGFAASANTSATVGGVVAAGGVVTSTVASPSTIDADSKKAKSRQKDLVTMIAMASLTKQGIATPTTDQVAAAVVDVKAKRDAGMGWGALANSLGLRLGDVVSASRSARRNDSDRRGRQEEGAQTAGLKTHAEHMGPSKRHNGKGDDAEVTSLWARIGAVFSGPGDDEAKGDRLSKRELQARREHRTERSSVTQAAFPTLIAQASLAKQGITAPTADQLTAAVAAVQTQRDSGMGWGAIANSLGLRLGSVVSEARATSESTVRAKAEEREGKHEHRAEVALTAPGETQSRGAERRSSDRASRAIDAPSKTEGARDGQDSASQGDSRSGRSESPGAGTSGGRSGSDGGKSESSSRSESSRSESSRSESSRSESNSRSESSGGHGGGKH
jgi:hypothetical protein